jgi:hypothetical protein
MNNKEFDLKTAWTCKSIMFYNLSSILVQNIKLYYNFRASTILRHLHRCPKVKPNFATCPKLGHGREHDLRLTKQKWECTKPATTTIKKDLNSSVHSRQQYFPLLSNVNVSTYA